MVYGLNKFDGVVILADVILQAWTVLWLESWKSAWGEPMGMAGGGDKFSGLTVP